MSHVILYLDESGDLGFKNPNSSKYFIITLLKIESSKIQKEVVSAVKRTIKNKLSSKEKRVDQELKGAKTSLSIKSYFLKQMPTEGWSLYGVILNKDRIYKHLQTPEGQKRLYNYLAKFLLENVELDESVMRVDVYIDKCKNNSEIKEFNAYIKAHLNLSPKALLNIDHPSSHENPAIQAVDLFCWGIARKHHWEETEWYDMYSGKIIFEEVYLPGTDKKKGRRPL